LPPDHPSPLIFIVRQKSMKHSKSLANAELLQQSRPHVSEIPRLRKLIVEQGLVGLANDPKWNELITHFRTLPDASWRPSYRFRCIDSGYVSEWDTEWWYHLPFPFIAVMWFDISFVQSTRGHHLLPASEVDHSASIMHILDRIGFDHQKAEDYIRIFGYAPRDYTDFDKNEK
jgi:hypothetical protein